MLFYCGFGLSRDSCFLLYQFFLTVPWTALWSVIVAFSVRTHVQVVIFSISIIQQIIQSTDENVIYLYLSQRLAAKAQ